MKRLVSILLTLAMLATMMAPALATNLGFNPDPSPIAGTGFQDLANAVLGAVQWIGYAFAIGMLIYVGIKYMMSAANEKADIKKGLINYVIGACILFAASSLVGFIKAFIGDAAPTTTATGS